MEGLFSPAIGAPPQRALDVTVGGRLRMCMASPLTATAI